MDYPTKSKHSIIRKLLEERDAEIDRLQALADNYECDLSRAKEENQRLRSCLEWYADLDCGDRARAALINRGAE